MDSPAAPPLPRPASPLRTELPITTTAPIKRQRRWSVAALCIVLAVIAGLGAAAAVTSAGDRVKVLAIARDVPAGQAITDADLRIAEVSADGALTPMRAAEWASVIGKRPAVDTNPSGAVGWLAAARAAASRGIARRIRIGSASKTTRRGR
ncbi:SAF domain-containing protein [Streptomyces sp. CBMA152]|uniref:SAF domain-containing protein n=1 Tax=Streptomyces sp. CBMA152 TaxID=1896312 RepID=UPI0016614584|nr:SAF domain-containing protein [Streptomyces sp. CBMA152]